jgi:hypothetical protein
MRNRGCKHLRPEDSPCKARIEDHNSPCLPSMGGKTRGISKGKSITNAPNPIVRRLAKDNLP